MKKLQEVLLKTFSEHESEKVEISNQDYLGLFLDAKKIDEIRKIAESEAVTTAMNKNREIIENQIHVKGIPTMIYDGKKHTGLYKASE